MYQLPSTPDACEHQVDPDVTPLERQRRREAAFQRRQENAELLQSILALSERFFPQPRTRPSGPGQC
jgi:hypothetical protein